MSAYSHCPDCGRKKVLYTARRNGEDGYYCTRRGCDFGFFTSSSSRLDLGPKIRWHAMNPDEGECDVKAADLSAIADAAQDAKVLRSFLVYCQENGITEMGRLRDLVQGFIMDGRTTQEIGRAHV